MTTQQEMTSVSTEVLVWAPAGHAFEVFTTGIGTWWDSDKHILAAPLAEMVFEPFVGGYIIDRGTDGSECRWSRVLAYDPPPRVVLSWTSPPPGNGRPTRRERARSRSSSRPWVRSRPEWC